MPRQAYMNPRYREFLYKLYRGGNLFVFPEHRDHDPGENGVGGFGDLYPANTPYVVISQGNLVKKLVGLALFQTSVFIFYISLGKVTDGNPPIYDAAISVYSNPLPHVLILTAIVVGVATTAVGLALVVRIQEAYGSVEEDDIQELDLADDLSNKSGCPPEQGPDQQ